MASFWYTKFVGKMMRANPAVDLDGDTFKVGLSHTVHVPNKDDAFLDDGGADDFVDGESNVTGYVSGFGNSGRKTLVNRTCTDDLTNDRVVLDADDLVWTSLANFANAIAQATLLKEITNDTASICMMNLDFPDINPNGNDLTVAFAATGIGYSQE